MDVIAREIERFDAIVRECGKQGLQLRIRALDQAAIGLHLVVSNPRSGAAYQVGRSWPGSFRRDLEHGVFG